MLTTHLIELLEKKEFVVTAEVSPPHGADRQFLLSRLETVRDYCDAVNITDNVRGIPSMSSMVCCHFIIDSGMEPVMQLSSRDRNRIAIESELYGAYALGVRNILFVTGDHTLLGSHPQAKMVYDIDSIQALQIASHLMRGEDLAGDRLDGTPEFILGSTFNPNADPMELHVWRVEKKADAGARFFQTQAIYDVDRFRDFMMELGGNYSVLAGIIPLKGPKMARFMQERIPGMLIPDELVTRLERAGEGLRGAARRSAVRAEGVQIAIDTIEQVKKIRGVNGIHIMSVGWDESVPEIVRGTGLYPRPRRE